MADSHEATANRLLPCQENCGAYLPIGEHAPLCSAYYRPAVAAALAAGELDTVKSSRKDWIDEHDKKLKQLLDAQAEIAQLKAEVERLKVEVEQLAWNLGGCDSYAMGYDLDKPLNNLWTRPALESVRKLALEARDLRARLAEAEEHEKQTHECLGAILGTDDSLEQCALRLRAERDAAEIKGMERAHKISRIYSSVDRIRQEIQAEIDKAQATTPSNP